MHLSLTSTSITTTRAGSTLTGSLRLSHDETSPSPTHIDHLSITLSGRAQTDIDRHHHSSKASKKKKEKLPSGCVFQGQCILLSMRKVLVEGSSSSSTEMLPQDSSSWSFEFQVPDRCAVAPQEQGYRHWYRFDDDDDDGRLPPAFASSCTRKCDRDLTAVAANAAIVYEIRACLVAKGTRLEAVEPVLLTTTRYEEIPRFIRTAAQAEVALQSARLLLTQDGHRNSPSLLGSRRLRCAVSNKPPPFAAFRLALGGSRGAVIGQSFQLQLSIKVLPDNRPRIYLVGLEVKLRAQTSIQCSGSRCFKPGCLSIHKGDEYEDWDEELLVDSWGLAEKKGKKLMIAPISKSSPGLEIPSAASDALTSSGLDLQRHTVVPSYFVPSFRSAIVSRNYTLDVGVRISYTGKMSTHNFVTRNFLLLAKDYAPRPSPQECASGSTSPTLCSENGTYPVPEENRYA
ncbi:MAG: hypothetical protein Q9210_005209 [Variospora velana]